MNNNNNPCDTYIGEGDAERNEVSRSFFSRYRCYIATAVFNFCSGMVVIHAIPMLLMSLMSLGETDPFYSVAIIISIPVLAVIIFVNECVYRYYRNMGDMRARRYEMVFVGIIALVGACLLSANSIYRYVSELW